MRVVVSLSGLRAGQAYLREQIFPELLLSRDNVFGLKESII